MTPPLLSNRARSVDWLSSPTLFLGKGARVKRDIYYFVTYGTISSVDSGGQRARNLTIPPWNEVQFAMFTAVFDASGTIHDQRYLVVAGFVASMDDWKLFDRDWRKRLNQDGIAYFHRVDCENNNREFAGWKGKDRAKKNLLFDLISIIKSHTYRKFGCMITNRIVESELTPEIKAKFHLHAYAFAGIVSISQVYK